MGIKFEYTAPGTLPQNRVVERVFVTLIGTGRAMMNHVGFTVNVENFSSLFFQISCSQGILNSSRLSCYLLLRLLVYMYLSKLMRTFTNYLKCIVISS